MEQEAYSPRRADIYSLGCIFMHVVIAIYFKQPSEGCSTVLGGDVGKRAARIEDYFHQQDSHYARSFQEDSGRLPKALGELFV